MSHIIDVTKLGAMIAQAFAASLESASLRNGGANGDSVLDTVAEVDPVSVQPVASTNVLPKASSSSSEEGVCEGGVEPGSEALVSDCGGVVDSDGYVTAGSTGTGDGLAEMEATSGGGFMATYVRTARNRRLLNILQVMSNHKLPRSSMGDIALASYAAGAMPHAFERGRERLKVLACLGDAAMLAAAISRLYKSGGSMDSVQNYRTQVLSDVALSKAFSISPLLQEYVPGAVDVSLAKSGATALEAFAGVLYLHSGVDAVEQLLQAVRLTAPGRN